MATTKQIVAFQKQQEHDHNDGTHTRLVAPTGKYRVVGVDTFEGPTADYLIGDYNSLSEAKEACQEHGGQMNPCYVYSDSGSGEWIYSAGTP